MGVLALRTRLASVRTVLLDTMVFAYHLADHPDYSPLTAVVLDAVESGPLTGLATVVTLAELLTQPARAGDRRAMQEYELFLTHFPHLQLAPMDVDLARETALVRAETGLRTPDAIQVAAGRLHRADAIVTNDLRWRGRVVRPDLILLDDYLGRDADP
jgi:predicted nucleic acid-binding protein